MDDKGVYAVARSVWECEAFMRQRFTQREAWLWLIGAAVWKQTRVNVDGKWLILERSEFSHALRFLAVKWKWSKDSVARFMLFLKSEDMIRDTSRDGAKVYSINKYNEFQIVGLPKRDVGRDGNCDNVETPARQRRDKEEELQTLEEKKEVKEEARAPSKPIVASSLPVWLDLPAWAGYCDMRRKKRAPMGERAQELVLQKLDRWRQLGHDPTAILDYSTQNSYTGVFEPRAEGHRNGKRDGPSNHENFAAGALAAARDFGESGGD